MAWTEKQKEYVAAAWKAGDSASEIAGALGPEFTRGMVIGVVHRMGLSGRQRVQRMMSLRNPPKPKRDDAAPRRAPTPIETFFPAMKEEPQGGVSFLDVRDGQCRWPVGGRSLDEFRFCGEKSEVGSYCREHHNRSRGRGTIGEQKALEGMKV